MEWNLIKLKFKSKDIGPCWLDEPDVPNGPDGPGGTNWHVEQISLQLKKRKKNKLLISDGYEDEVVPSDIECLTNELGLEASNHNKEAFILQFIEAFNAFLR